VSFREILEDLTAHKGPRCSMCLLFEDLDRLAESDPGWISVRNDIEASLAKDTIHATTISKGIAKLGIRPVPDHTIRRHRTGECQGLRS
jgi:hypothetical protein